ncbi:phage portal protein, partial [Bacillus sp. G16]|nr:phage portal protein [Bacillus sp. G16]
MSRKVTARVIKSNVPGGQVISRQKEAEDEQFNVNGMIEPPYDISALLVLSKEESTIVPQCIDAYKRNIAGFGHELQYKQPDIEETADMKKEWVIVDQEIIPTLSIEKPFKEVWEQLIED